MTPITFSHKTETRGRKRTIDIDDTTERNREYAKQKGKEKKTCVCCNMEVSYYSWSKHQKTKRHISLQEEANKQKE